MKVYYDINEIEKNQNTVLTVGTFDGVHLGHQKIINEMIFHSIENKCRNLVITFEPHPQIVLSKNNSIKILSTLDEKLNYLSYLGIENVLVIKFTKEFSQIDFKTFIKDYLIDKIGLHTIVVGSDHHFGRNREGTPEQLIDLGNEFNFHVVKVEPLMFAGSKISSTRIRKSLLNGEIQLANEMLGKKFELSGRVVKGSQRGASIGIPTANIQVENKDKLIPARGVYFVEVDVLEKDYYGMMNIGFRPTFNNSNELILEVHIFFFDENIYDNNIKVRFVDRLRDEKKFESIDELKNQLLLDKKECFKRFDPYNLSGL